MRNINMIHIYPFTDATNIENTNTTMYLQVACVVKNALGEQLISACLRQTSMISQTSLLYL